MVANVIIMAKMSKIVTKFEQLKAQADTLPHPTLPLPSRLLQLNVAEFVKNKSPTAIIQVLSSMFIIMCSIRSFSLRCHFTISIAHCLFLYIEA